jgi:hypothetical protein
MHAYNTSPEGGGMRDEVGNPYLWIEKVEERLDETSVYPMWERLHPKTKNGQQLELPGRRGNLRQWNWKDV